MKFILALAFLFIYSAAFGQTPVPTHYTFASYLESALGPGANGTEVVAPISTYDFTAAATQCDQPPTALSMGAVANPRYIRFTDPERPTRECVFDTTANGGVLFALPFGNRYVARLTAKINVGGVEFASSASEVSNPFVRGAAPARVVGLRVGG